MSRLSGYSLEKLNKRLNKGKETKMSKFLSINISDFSKALAVMVASSVLVFIQQLIKDKGLDWNIADFYQMLDIAVLSALGYLAKNLLTNSEGTLLKGE